MKIWLPAIQTGSGTDVFTLRLADALRRRGHEAMVQFFPHRHEPCPLLLRRVAAPAGTDVIHGNSWSAHAFARTGIPLLVTEHHYIQDPAFLPYRGRLQRIYHDALIRPQLRASYRSAATLTAVSTHTANAMQADGCSGVTVVHNWVDTNHFRPAAHRSRSPGPLRCLFVGNPAKRKGSDLLPLLAEQLGDTAELLCLGGLREQARSTGATGNLHALERRDTLAMPALYNSVDVLLAPTRYEAFGYTTLEAMACGLPVAGFASTGTAEICVDGETALLSAIDDVPAMADNIRRLATDEAMRARLGAAGRSRAMQVFTEEQALQGYLTLYQQLIDARG